jgi:N-acetyl-gamma-glutamyl-phosphate reductase
VARADRVANPGCYPSGFIALIAPLVRSGLLPADWPYTVNAVSGYSGGGKALIERFEEDRDIAFRAYGLGMGHKHVPEMTAYAGVVHPPLFAPSVIAAHRGMWVEVPLPLGAMAGAASPDALRAGLAAFYEGSAVVRVADAAVPGEMLLRGSMAPSDALTLHVFGSADGAQARLVAVLDNLGKGASGAAVQSLNLMAGLPETSGLAL